MAEKKTKKKTIIVVEFKHLDHIWDVIDEMQKNVDFLNDKVQRILNRMGLE